MLIPCPSTPRNVAGLSRGWGSVLSDLKSLLEARRSVRAFTDQPVDMERLTTLIQTAARAPSGGNVQPWHVYMLGGRRMAEFRGLMQTRIATGQADTPEYPVYPAKLGEPYRSRRFKVGEDMYARLGIPREDKAKRLEWFARNWQFFDAPAGLFLFVGREMGAAQWSDLGMFLQSLMLLLVEEGLASCPQEAWAMHHSAVSDFCKAPADQMLFCGLAIGYEDRTHPVNDLRTTRAPLDEWLTIL
jgi:nitroreductase